MFLNGSKLPKPKWTEIFRHVQLLDQECWSGTGHFFSFSFRVSGRRVTQESDTTEQNQKATLESDTRE